MTIQVTKDARKLVLKDTVGHKEPEELPRYTYKKFHLNSEFTNKSKIVRLTVAKVNPVNHL